LKKGESLENSRLMAKGILGAFEKIGVKIDKMENDTIFLSIPKIVHDKIDTNGEDVAKRIQELFTDSSGNKKLVIKYKLI
jgi:hypothetical protein